MLVEMFLATIALFEFYPSYFYEAILYSAECLLEQSSAIGLSIYRNSTRVGANWIESPPYRPFKNYAQFSLSSLLYIAAPPYM